MIPRWLLFVLQPHTCASTHSLTPPPPPPHVPPPQRGEASWGNTTASWLQRSWMT